MSRPLPLSNFIVLLSTFNTPIYVRKNAVLFIEGFTFEPNHSQCPGHNGARLTLKSGQWGETVYCKEAPEEVFKRVEP